MKGIPLVSFSVKSGLSQMNDVIKSEERIEKGGIFLGWKRVRVI